MQPPAPCPLVLRGVLPAVGSVGCGSCSPDRCRPFVPFPKGCHLSGVCSWQEGFTEGSQGRSLLEASGRVVKVMGGGPGSQHREGTWLQGPLGVTGASLWSKSAAKRGDVGAGGIQGPGAPPACSPGGGWLSVPPLVGPEGTWGQRWSPVGGQTWHIKCLCTRKCAHIHPQA